MRQRNMALARFLNIFNLTNGNSSNERDGKPGVAGIIQLPDELLLHIGSFLSLPSQACLALTCKTFFNLTGEVLGSRKFDLPPLMPGYGLGAWRVGHSLRWELLCLLEDARWLICSRCIKLRPINRFPPGPLPGCRSRRCVYGLHDGIVEICPCVRMSFSDKLNLMDQLEALREESHNERSYFWHECLVVHEDGKVLTQAQPVLQDDGSLVFQMWYSIKTASIPTDVCVAFPDLPLFRCPHKEITYTVSAAFWRVRYLTDHCRQCETSLVNINHFKNANESQYILQVKRNLGKRTEQADETWAKQSDFRFDSFGTNEENRTRSESEARELASMLIEYAQHADG